MADEPRLSPAAYERLTERAQELGLLEDPDTLGALRCINPSRPRSLDRKLFAYAEERIIRFAQHRRDLNPFATPRPPVNSSGLLLGTEFDTQRPIFATSRDLSRHTLITAPTGGTKTVYAHQLMLQGRAHGLHAWIADPKLDAQYLAAMDDDFLIISPSTPFNLLQPLLFVHRAQHIQLVAHVFAKTHYGGEHTTQVLEIALTKAYDQYPVPCFADVLAVVETLAPKGSTYGWADAVRGVQHKLWRLRDQYPVAFTTRHCNLLFLFSRSLYLPLLFQSTSDEFVLAVLAHLLFLHHYRAGIRELDTLLLYDEGLTSWSSRPANIDQTPILANLQVQLREMGIGMLVTTASISMTSPLLKSNVHVRVTMGAGNPADLDELTRTFQLTTEQRDYLTKRITPGQAIVKVGTDTARLVTFPDLPHNKTVAPSTWDRALRRTDILRPTPPLQLTPKVAAASDERTREQPTTARPLAPSSRIAPVSATSPSNSEERKVSPNRVALNTHGTALMNDVSENPYTLTTPCFHRCNLRLSEGDRVKTLLTNLGFLESYRVCTGAGRGKTGSALRLTPAGWAWLGRTPPKGTRGGDSAQHEFVVQHLSRLIHRSSIETLGADLVIPFNVDEHAQLYRALETLSGRAIALNSGDLIALEVECSRPDVTAPRNIARNSGLALTVIATFPKDIPSLRRRVPHNDRVVIIDVLRLLDALRLTEAR